MSKREAMQMIRQYERVRRLGCEFFSDAHRGDKNTPLLKFRFSEGLGMLCGLHYHQSQVRIDDAKSRLP